MWSMLVPVCRAPLLDTRLSNMPSGGAPLGFLNSGNLVPCWQSILSFFFSQNSLFQNLPFNMGWFGLPETNQTPLCTLSPVNLRKNALIERMVESAGVLLWPD